LSIAQGEVGGASSVHSGGKDLEAAEIGEPKQIVGAGQGGIDGRLVRNGGLREGQMEGHHQRWKAGKRGVDDGG